MKFGKQLQLGTYEPWKDYVRLYLMLVARDGAVDSLATVVHVCVSILTIAG